MGSCCDLFLNRCLAAWNLACQRRKKNVCVRKLHGIFIIYIYIESKVFDDDVSYASALSQIIQWEEPIKMRALLLSLLYTSKFICTIAWRISRYQKYNCFNFSWDHCRCQEKVYNAYAKFWREKTKIIVVFLILANSILNRISRFWLVNTDECINRLVVTKCTIKFTQFPMLIFSYIISNITQLLLLELNVSHRQKNVVYKFCFSWV